MARYTGPKSRIARKFGEGIFGADKVLSKKNYPPGQHGNNRRRKTSEYGVMLAEKQKAKYTYGVLEKQFRNLFEKAASANGITGEILLQSLEARLDNVVFRLGIAPTRAAARQLVSHKHITVSGTLYMKISLPVPLKYRPVQFFSFFLYSCFSFFFSFSSPFPLLHNRIKCICRPCDLYDNTVRQAHNGFPRLVNRSCMHTQLVRTVCIGHIHCIILYYDMIRTALIP